MTEYLYQFAVLRYVHDPVTEEFLNIGVVVYAPDAHYLKALINQNYGRLSDAFQKVNGAFYHRLTQSLENRLNFINEKLSQGQLFEQAPARLELLLGQILPPDDSSLRFSGFGGGFSADLDSALTALYQRLVTQYIEKTEISSRDDNQVWQVYREAFAKHDIIDHLDPITIATPTFEHEFSHAWKNERWHPVEPVSLDLVQARSITDKTSRWIGHARSLAQSPVLGKIYMLLGAPSNPALQDSYQRAIERIRQETENVQIVEEEEAAEFSETFAQMIQEHET